MQRTKQAHMAVLAANLLFGINFSAVKLLTPHSMPPLALNLARMLGSALLFWGIFLIKPGKFFFRKSDSFRFLLCTLSGVVLNQVMFIKGLSLTSGIHAGLLMLSTPLFITAASTWLLKEKLTAHKILGLVLGIIGGTILIAGKTSLAQGKQMVLGDLLIVANATMYAVYFVWVKALMVKYEPIQVIRWVFTLGTLILLPFAWVPLQNTSFSAMPTKVWIALGFVVFGGTFLPYLFNVYGLKYLGPAITGSYIYSQPFFASLFAILFLNEKFGWQHATAGLFIGLGVWLINKQPHPFFGQSKNQNSGATS